jgi:hypothetical protein
MLTETTDQAATDQAATTLLDELRGVLTARAYCEAGWADLSAKRISLLSKITDSEIDTSCLNGYVSVANRTAKLDLPELAELRLAIDEARQVLVSENAEAIYAAQIAAQEADEALSSLLTNSDIEAMESAAALLVARHAGDQPERTSSLVVRKRAQSLLLG